MLLEIVFAHFEDPEEDREVFERKTVLWRHILLFLARVEPCVELGQHFAKLDVVKFVTLEQFKDAQLQQEYRIVERLRVSHLLLPRREAIVDRHY